MKIIRSHLRLTTIIKIDITMLIASIIAFIVVYLIIYHPHTISKITYIIESLIGELTRARLSQSAETCKKNVVEDLEKQKRRSPVDFAYKIFEIKEFDDPTEAENFAKEYVSPFSNYKICRKIIKSYYPIEEIIVNFTSIVVVLVEFRFSSPIFGIEKATDVYYCNEKGEILRKSFTDVCYYLND